MKVQVNMDEEVFTQVFHRNNRAFAVAKSLFCMKFESFDSFGDGEQITSADIKIPDFPGSW